MAAFQDIKRLSESSESCHPKINLQDLHRLRPCQTLGPHPWCFPFLRPGDVSSDSNIHLGRKGHQEPRVFKNESSLKIIQTIRTCPFLTRDAMPSWNWRRVQYRTGHRCSHKTMLKKRGDFSGAACLLNTLASNFLSSLTQKNDSSCSIMV